MVKKLVILFGLGLSFPHSQDIKLMTYNIRYDNPNDGDNNWANIKTSEDSTFNWDITSTYVKPPPFFDINNYKNENNIIKARALAMFGDSITTDHISPAGGINLIVLPENIYQRNKLLTKNLILMEQEEEIMKL